MVLLFIHLLLIANHEPRQWKGIKIQKGQVVTGLDSLNKATGISIQSLRTCLGRMEKGRELTSKSTNRFRIITLCNYDTYQLTPNDTNKLTNKQLTANKNVKNDKNVNNEKKKSRFTPPTVDELREYSSSIDFGLDCQGFLDFYTSKGWMIGKNKMKDWKAAVRTWKKRDPKPVEETAALAELKK